MSIELLRKPTEEEIERLCIAAETAARRVLLSRISLKKISDMDVTVEAIGDKPLTLNVGVSLETTTNQPGIDKIVDEATEAAFAAAEREAMELNLCKAI